MARGKTTQVRSRRILALDRHVTWSIHLNDSTYDEIPFAQAPVALVDFVSSFSVIPHFDGFQKGVLDSRDIIFFFSIIGFALFTTGVVIRNLRSGH